MKTPDKKSGSRTRPRASLDKASLKHAMSSKHVNFRIEEGVEKR
jgi:hypothetical protein